MLRYALNSQAMSSDELEKIVGKPRREIDDDDAPSRICGFLFEPNKDESNYINYLKTKEKGKEERWPGMERRQGDYETYRARAMSSEFLIAHKEAIEKEREMYGYFYHPLGVGIGKKERMARKKILKIEKEKILKKYAEEEKKGTSPMIRPWK